MRWCTGRGIDPLTARRADVELWLRSVADSGLARASIAAHYDAVASLYRLAHQEELVAVNPCARVARPKIHRELQRREVLTVLEYAAYLTAARALGPTHHAIAVLAGMMGLRATEMPTLPVESFATVRGYATLLVIGKGDKPVRVPVPIPAGPSARTPCAARLAPWGSTKAFRCGTCSACCATSARKPPSGATTSPAMPWNATPPTRSPGSSPVGPAEPKTSPTRSRVCPQATHYRTVVGASALVWVCPASSSWQIFGLGRGRSGSFVLVRYAS